MICKEIHLFFYKQPGYKQLALEQQIAQQLSRLNPFSLSHNKKYRLRKSVINVINVILFVINVKLLLNEQYSTIQLFQKPHWNFKILKSLILNINFES